MLNQVELAAALTSTATQLLDRYLYRAVDLETLFGFHHDPPYPEPRPLWSLGAPRHGARFTPPGGPASLYMAEDANTAFAEALQVSNAVLETGHFIANPPPPKVLYSAKVYLEAVLDLTIPTVQAALATSVAELTGPWRLLRLHGQVPPTHQLGQAVFDSGRYQGIRYPSARSPGSACVVIFSDRLKSPALVEVFDPNGNLKGRIPPS